MKKLGRSLLFAALAVAVLAVLLWFGDAPTVIAVIERFQSIDVLWFLLLMVAHESIRAVLWSILLRSLAIGVPPRARMFSFAAGEAAKFVPTGAYLQNYILQRSSGTDFGRSSAATTLMILAEIAVALIGFLILGLGTWSIYVRLAIIVAGALALYLLRPRGTLPEATPLPRWLARHGVVSRVIGELRRFRAGLAALSHPRLIVETLAWSAVYVFMAGAGLYVVVRGLGIEGVSLWQAVAVSCFGLAFYVVLGSLEAADVGALIGIGVSKSAAVSAILVNRVLGVGLTIVLALIVMAALPGEWRSVLRPRPDKTVEGATSPTTETTLERGATSPTTETTPEGVPVRHTTDTTGSAGRCW